MGVGITAQTHLSSGMNGVKRRLKKDGTLEPYPIERMTHFSCINQVPRFHLPASGAVFLSVK